MLKNILIQPKSLLFIFISVLILVVITVFNEKSQSRKEVLTVLESQSHSLLETILVSSQEVLYASNEVEEEIRIRLLNNASIIKILFQENKLSDLLLKDIAANNNLNRINVFDKNANLLYSNIENKNDGTSGLYASEFLQPIFEGFEDTVIVGIREAERAEGYRYIVALATEEDGAIVLNLNAEELLEFRKRVGFGILLNKLADNAGVIYTALQDTNGIIAASGNVNMLDLILPTGFLDRLYKDKLFDWRFYDFDSTEVFEAVHRFELEGETVGLFRIGLSLDPLNQVYDKITKRIIIFGVLLLILGTFLLSIVFTRQNFNVLKKQYDYIESFANKLINNANDLIIVLDENKFIKEINPAALKYFGKTEPDAISKPINEILSKDSEKKILETDSNIIETECEINGESKNLIISRSEFKDSQGRINYVLIIRDVTQLKELEEQVSRSKQLSAMGHLASGVAHEIRNPLNSIGTIIQQLRRDFEPKEDTEDYKKFTSVIYKEVQRINKTIESFLKLARPQPVVRKEFRLSSLFDELSLQYSQILKEKSIRLEIENEFNGSVYWDKDQMRQVFINLISNAIDSIEQNGTIKIATSLINDIVHITIDDNGKGISKENIDKIFDLYFTTKAEGTGIGLGIVQRIINEHDGIITVTSKPGEGTKFTMKIKQG